MTWNMQYVELARTGAMTDDGEGGEIPAECQKQVMNWIVSLCLHLTEKWRLCLEKM